MAKSIILIRMNGFRFFPDINTIFIKIRKLAGNGNYIIITYLPTIYVVHNYFQNLNKQGQEMKIVKTWL